MNNTDKSINSVAEEDVATMLPTVDLNGDPLTKDNINHESDEDIIKDIEFSEAVIDYINIPELQYDDLVEEGVGKIVGKIKERVVVSRSTCKLVVDIYMLKKRIKKANNRDNQKLVIDLKRELIQKQKELSEIKRTSSPELQKEISNIEKTLEKNTAKFNIEDIKTESVENEDIILEGTSVTKEIAKRLEKSVDDPVDDNIILEKEDDTTLPPELKRLDELRGQIENLTDDLNKAKEKFSETGEKLYENKIKGLTAKIEKKEKELAEKEKEAEKIQGEEITTEAYLSKFKSKEDNSLNIDQRITGWKNTLDGVKQKLKDTIALRSKTTLVADRNELDKKIRELTKMQVIFERNIKELEEEKKTGKKARIVNYRPDRRYENKNKPVYASTDDILFDFDIMTEAANMEDEIKSIVDKLNSKGYKVKYASPGHRQLRKKEDAEPDGVYYGKLYSDARIMFEDKYSFHNAPKYWHWREVEGCSYLDITPISYNKDDGTPDKAFADWKTNYMNSLKSFVDDLKDNSDKDVKESVNKFAESFIEEMFERMGFNDDIEALNVNENITQESNSNDLIKELDNLLS